MDRWGLNLHRSQRSLLLPEKLCFHLKCHVDRAFAGRYWSWIYKSIDVQGKVWNLIYFLYLSQTWLQNTVAWPPLQQTQVTRSISSSCVELNVLFLRVASFISRLTEALSRIYRQNLKGARTSWPKCQKCSKCLQCYRLVLIMGKSRRQYKHVYRAQSMWRMFERANLSSLPVSRNVNKYRTKTSAHKHAPPPFLQWSLKDEMRVWCWLFPAVFFFFYLHQEWVQCK